MTPPEVDPVVAVEVLFTEAEYATLASEAMLFGDGTIRSIVRSRMGLRPRVVPLGTEYRVINQHEAVKRLGQ